jgi:hypothetical protein
MNISTWLFFQIEENLHLNFNILALLISEIKQVKKKVNPTI